ncbi:MAG: D-alanine--D-alanine ligase family protein, partial [Candidatus Dormibacteria bacterium]
MSLQSGQAVQRALREAGHEPELIEPDRQMFSALGRSWFEVAFIALHGRGGEDGCVQGACELLGVPYTGSGVLASALCMDKVRCNHWLAGLGLAVPPFEELPELSEPELLEPGLLAERYGLPLVIKPVREGSTLGLTIALREDQIAAGWELARQHDRRVMVQRFVAGTEITTAVIATPEPEVLPMIEISYQGPVYDYAAKYTAGGSRHIIPARIAGPARERAEASARAAFVGLGCEGLARIDAIVDGAGVPWLLEVNTVPG